MPAKQFVLTLEEEVGSAINPHTLKLLPALNFATELYDSTLKDRDYRGAEGEVTMCDKLLCTGWSEHGSVCEAFVDTHRIETHIYPSPWSKTEAEVNVKFFKDDSKEPHFEINASINLLSGRVGVRMLQIG